MHEHKHTLIIKKPTCNHSLLAPLLPHILASFCKVAPLMNVDKQLLFSPPCCLSSRGWSWDDCVPSPHTQCSATVNSIQKSHTSPTNSRKTRPEDYLAPCLGAEAAKAPLTCSADCWLQILSKGEIFLALVTWGPLLLVCSSHTLSLTKEGWTGGEVHTQLLHQQHNSH